MTDTVYVTNTNDKPLTVEYGAKEMLFAPNQKVKISLAAARHIFGYGMDDKLQVLASLGLTVTTNDIPQGLERLSKFVITPVEEAPNRSLAPVVESVPLPARRGGGKFQSAHH